MSKIYGHTLTDDRVIVTVSDSGVATSPIKIAIEEVSFDDPTRYMEADLSLENVAAILRAIKRAGKPKAE